MGNFGKFILPYYQKSSRCDFILGTGKGENQNPKNHAAMNRTYQNIDNMNFSLLLYGRYQIYYKFGNIFYLGIVLITVLTIVKYFDILILSVPVERLQLKQINEMKMKHQEDFRVSIIIIQIRKSMNIASLFLLVAPVIGVNSSKCVKRKCRTKNELRIFEYNISNIFQFRPNNSSQIPKCKD